MKCKFDLTTVWKICHNVYFGVVQFLIILLTLTTNFDNSPGDTRFPRLPSISFHESLPMYLTIASWIGLRVSGSILRFSISSAVSFFSSANSFFSSAVSFFSSADSFFSSAFSLFSSAVSFFSSAASFFSSAVSSFSSDVPSFSSNVSSFSSAVSLFSSASSFFSSAFGSLLASFM